MIAAFTKLVASITEVDITLAYDPSDVEWFVSTLERGQSGKAIIKMFQSYFAAQDEYLTPAEAAEITPRAESTWKNNCNWDKVPGAIKKGKQWLIPRGSLLLLGFELKKD